MDRKIMRVVFLLPPQFVVFWWNGGSLASTEWKFMALNCQHPCAEFYRVQIVTTHHCDGPQPLANLATTWEKKTPYGTNNLTITCQKLDYNFIWWSTLSNTNLFLWANAWACVNLLSKSRLQKFLATNWCRNLRLTLATIFVSLS